MLLMSADSFQLALIGARTFAAINGNYFLGLVDERVPCFAVEGDDLVVGCEDPV
jgi:hypothetical protein